MQRAREQKVMRGAWFAFAAILIQDQPVPPLYGPVGGTSPLRASYVGGTMPESEEGRWLTYEELAEQLGCSSKAARIWALRRGYPRRVPNAYGQRAQVLIPEKLEVSSRRRGNVGGTVGDAVPPAVEATPASADHVTQAIELLREQLSTMRERIDRAEQRADQAEERAAEERVRADRERERADRAEQRADDEHARADRAEERADRAERRAEADREWADEVEQRLAAIRAEMDVRRSWPVWRRMSWVFSRSI